MGSAKREASLDKERQSLEAAYTDALILALGDCARGRWGLFHQNSGIVPAHLEERHMPESAKQLERIGIELASVRERLGFADMFAPMQRLNELRAAHGPNQPGEPRLAQMFLDELTA
ncbi:hypothetical protein FJV83_10730 [Mesorhizobium sp. WSM4307]|uniref:hypothetical protein n=1 Tax=unclassified Mesorhizobium TaxID=325217 RepID=UPI00112A6DCE|nr:MULTISPECIES: hypothetical protein [unclassified Mesorhizobium]TPK64634.1 hypothetical protein FJ546_12100 [Mesorhizobium sp. B2-4-19]TRC78749.1 hypothetical protein FJV81_07635 [Mesorhizobium sp. WSM4315]TRC85378.1 hypothetical protein FJV83_10730 [Mesorhizobium sp. WSM4307]